MNTKIQREEYLIAVLRSHAIELETNDAITAMQVINKMITNNASEIDYIIALSDGLKYGNWPWVNQISKPKSKCEFCYGIGTVEHFTSKIKVTCENCNGTGIE